jgi:hypothetical protein
MVLDAAGPLAAASSPMRLQSKIIPPANLEKYP